MSAKTFDITFNELQLRLMAKSLNESVAHHDRAANRLRLDGRRHLADVNEQRARYTRDLLKHITAAIPAAPESETDPRPNKEPWERFADKEPLSEEQPKGIAK